jgi:orotidine-5'-phosphate decarboxylase
MNYNELANLIKQKKTFLCVGLDTDISLIPRHLLKYEDPVFEFNKLIIDATRDICVAYKPNIAFYESYGIKGWQALEKTIRYLNETTDCFTIADAKRGDIGNTSNMYAKAFFEWLNFDSVTVAPYMGEDSVTPFLQHKNKWVILLGLTSNAGSKDFQFLETGQGKLYETVITRAQQWASHEQLMFVIGATHPEYIAAVRKLAPDNFFLVPGVGAQGGDMEAVCREGRNSQGGLLINSTRQVIYASGDIDFDAKAREQALELNAGMSTFID